MLADSFRCILWAGRLQPWTYMFMITNNGWVETSNHQGEFQHNQYSQEILSPLSPPLFPPPPSGPSPSSFQNDLWPCHSRIPHRALYRRKVEVTTSSMERVHFIHKTWHTTFDAHSKHAMQWNPHTPTHPHTHTHSYLSSLTRSTANSQYYSC